MTDRVWRKSSASGAGNDCVEVRWTLDAVRDSKNPNAGMLAVDIRTLAEWLRS
jgi:Domain of unknown function (DUF397)